MEACAQFIEVWAKLLADVLRRLAAPPPAAPTEAEAEPPVATSKKRAPKAPAVALHSGPEAVVVRSKPVFGARLPLSRRVVDRVSPDARLAARYVRARPRGGNDSDHG
jgi:hypothetical protein